MISQNKRLFGIVLGVALLLLIPLVAGFPWTLGDFVVAGILLLSTGLVCELVMRTVKNKDYQIGLIAGALVVLFLIWAELAVGIFGSPFAGS